MKLPDGIYDLLKWILMIVVPAFMTLLNALATAWAWEIPIEAINITITAVAAFLGVCVGISNHNYYKGE